LIVRFERLTHLSDVSLEVPRGEEDVTDSRVNGDRPGVFNSGPERFPVPAVLEFGDVHVLSVAVHPVELVVDPVDGDALKAVGVVIDLAKNVTKLFFSSSLTQR
jgi:hypothetical protein